MYIIYKTRWRTDKLPATAFVPLNTPISSSAATAATVTARTSQRRRRLPRLSRSPSPSFCSSRVTLVVFSYPRQPPRPPFLDTDIATTSAAAHALCVPV